MIKIQANDILWKGYKAYYNNLEDEPYPPKPKNLCSYFWTSLIGLLSMMVNAQTSILFFLNNLVFTSGVIIWSMDYYPHNPPIILQVFLILACLITLTSLVFSVICIFSYTEPIWSALWNHTPQWVKRLLTKLESIFLGIFRIVFLLGILSLLIYFIIKVIITYWSGAPEEVYELNFAFTLIGALIGIILIAFGAFILTPLFQRFSSVSRLTQQIKSLLWGIKNNVCPIVIPPPEWEENNERKPRVE